MQKRIVFVLMLLCLFGTFKKSAAQDHPQNSNPDRINLAGDWSFQIDSIDQGVQESWFNNKLPGHIKLPGSMTTNGLGNDIDVATPWTATLSDSSWYTQPQYAKYRVKGNVKVPFWLQPIKYYKGAAWYQKEVTIPSNWKGDDIELFVERSHWETSVWVDSHFIGKANSLGTPDVFNLGKALTPGHHTITVCIDNRVKDINVGLNSHSITDHTQGNWNGMIGQLFLENKHAAYFDDVQIFPDVDKRQVSISTNIKKDNKTSGNLQLSIEVYDNEGHKLPPLTKSVTAGDTGHNSSMVVPMGAHIKLWDEFHPNLYQLKLSLLQNGKLLDKKELKFGMRKLATKGTKFTINGRVTFLRGTLDCAAYPLTGYPPTDMKSWIKVFEQCKSYGLNHIRFHSWCPPEAAFEAADQMGFYLQIECSSWANQGAVIGDGRPLDQFIYAESNRIVKTFGNHPSFCLMAYGNEPAGKGLVEYLREFVLYWQKKDPRRLYTTGAGWPVIKESDYNSTPDPRIQHWGAGLKSIINSQNPSTQYDWQDIISKNPQPTVSHEIGQWCVYPDFSEIDKYTGVLKAHNFEIFRDVLQEHGMGKLAHDFLYASGKLQALCYKADIEAALRTKGFGGFQLLGLNDFPGQGTALVGVVNTFWQDKGYITGKEYSQFCGPVIPLLRLPKMIYTNNETINGSIEIAQYGPETLIGTTPTWKILNEQGKVLFSGQLKKSDIPNGEVVLGTLFQSLNSIKEASRLIVKVNVAGRENSWDIFVYPAQLPQVNNDVIETTRIDQNVINELQAGKKVLLSIKKGSLKPEFGGNIAIGFSSIFWNTAWTNSQPPVTLGILCNPAHPALKYFPTQNHSNWQWFDAMTHSNALELDKFNAELDPIVRVIDDWVTARPLGLLFECKVGKGSLVVSGIDLNGNLDNRPEAKQLKYSVLSYMSSKNFNPSTQVAAAKLLDMCK